MNVAISKLQNGDWVHIFPEGSRSRDGGKTLGTIKRGIGRFVSSSILTNVEERIFNATFIPD